MHIIIIVINYYYFIRQFYGAFFRPAEKHKKRLLQYK